MLKNAYIILETKFKKKHNRNPKTKSWTNAPTPRDTVPDLFLIIQKCVLCISVGFLKVDFVITGTGMLASFQLKHTAMYVICDRSIRVNDVLEHI